MPEMHHILIVDDMKSFLNLEKSFLRRADCTIDTASTGVEAIKQAKSVRPDLILLDIEMPEMNGLEACRILTSDPSTKHIPIIIISTLEKRRDDAIKAGARDFLPKPITEEGFLAMVKKHTGIRLRGLPRVPVNFEVAARTKDGARSTSCRARDISETGIFLLCDEPAPLGTEVLLDFRLPDRAATMISTEGVVVRSVEVKDAGEGRAGAGIELTGLGEKERAALLAFVTSRRG